MSTRPESDGLHAPSGPVLPDVGLVRRRSVARIVIQTAGALIGLALLGWAITLAATQHGPPTPEFPQGRNGIETVLHAPGILIAELIGVSVASIILNGLMFWVVLRPLKKLSPLDVVLTNCLATFLAVLPFKINLVVRTLVHHRRDGVPLKDIVSWFAAVAALALAVLIPAGVAGLWRGGLDLLWWLTTVGGAVLISLAGVGLSVLAQRHRILSRLSLGADRIIRHPSAVLPHLGLRFSDLALLSARFGVAALIAGQSIAPEKLVILATTYFLLSVLAPFGSLGFREFIVAWVGKATGFDQSQIALIALTVTAGETLSSGVLSLPAFIRLRPDKLWVTRRS